jgi:hypothetical protein
MTVTEQLRKAARVLSWLGEPQAFVALDDLPAWGRLHDMLFG